MINGLFIGEVGGVFICEDTFEAASNEESKILLDIERGLDDDAIFENHVKRMSTAIKVGGCTISISNQIPSTFDEAGYAALDFKVIGSETA